MLQSTKRIQTSAITLLLSSTFYVTACMTSCTTSGSTQKAPSDVVAGDKNATTNGSEDLPPELQDAQRFDPAATLDPKTVQESDFYQIKQSVEQNKNALDAEWKEQERIEASIKAANQAEEQRKAMTAKQEEEERERQRQLAIKDYDKNAQKRAKEEKQAEDDVKKLPTINHDEVNWKGLED